MTKNYPTFIQQPMGEALTIYFPFRDSLEDGKDRTKSQQTKLKGWAESALRQYTALEDKKDFRLSIVSEIERIGGGLDFAYEGVGIFMDIDSEKEKIYAQFVEYYSYLPPKMLLVAPSFLMTPTYQSSYMPAGVIGVALNRYGCRIVRLDNNELSEIKFIENKHIIVDETNKESMKQYQSGYGWWNTGEDAAWIEEEQKHFMQDIATELNSLQGSAVRFFISSNIEKIMPATEKIFSTITIRPKSFVTKGTSDNWSIKDELMEYKRELHQETLGRMKKEIISSPQGSNSTGEVVDSLMRGQLETLLVGQDFITNNAIETYSEHITKYAPEADPAHPWLQIEQHARQQGTKIITVPGEEFIYGEYRFSMNP